MSPVKILVAENELLIAEIIAETVMNAGYEVSAKITRGEDLQEAVSQTSPDLLIMDIRLDGRLDGISAVSDVKTQQDIPVIYVTDIDDQQTMKRAEETSPSAYLVKPFNERQLLASIFMALHNFSTGAKATPGETALPAEAGSFVIRDAVFIRVKDGNLQKIRPAEIGYMEASSNYTYLYMTGNSRHLITNSMNRVLEQLTDPAFVRVHRSYAVNMNKVDAIKGNMLVVDKKEIPVGETYRADVMNRFSYLK